MSTITSEQQQAIAAYLATHELPVGIGTKDAACSMAAINLALTGRLTDHAPACMSNIIGRWIITVQDAMPATMRNSAAWKTLLPLAAGTGRALEAERSALIGEWLCTRVLPTLQSIADRYGFGAEWRTMCEHKTADAAVDVASIVYISARSARDAGVSEVARKVIDIMVTVARITANQAYEMDAGDAASDAATVASWAVIAMRAMRVQDAAASDTTASDFINDDYNAPWQAFDPCALLQKLIEVK